MAFVKRNVKDRVVQYPRRYQLVEVSQGIYDLVPVTGTVIEEGTAINKAYLQPIEDALEEFNSHKAEDASTTAKGHVQLNNTVTSTSTTQAATANAVKSAYDLASGAAKIVTGTYTGNDNDNRLINIGFTPKYVVVVKTGNQPSHFISNVCVTAGTIKNNCYITTNGFIVSYNSAEPNNLNTSSGGNTYYYVAIG
jgi:phage-related tail fiber protein